MTIGVRLREERDRLGFSQSDFAALVGASRKTQMRWEQEEGAHPDAAALAVWAKEGLDVLYVVLGGDRGDGGSGPELPPDEELLIEAFRAMKPKKRKNLLASLLTGGDGGLDSKRDGVNVTGSGNRTAGGDYHEG